MIFKKILIISASLILFFPIIARPKTLIRTESKEVPELITLLKSGNKDKRENAAYKLGLLEPQLDKTKAISALINVMNDPSKQVRISAISALGELKAVEAKDSLIKALHNKDEEIKLFAAQSIGTLGKQAESADSDLLPLLNNSNFRIRQVTAIALAKIGANLEQAVRIMTNDLNCTNEYERFDAVLALGYMGKSANPAISELKKLLLDTSEMVSQEACRTLRNIGTSESKEALNEYQVTCDSHANENINTEQKITMLIEDLNLPNQESRLFAISALGRMGNIAQPAIPSLKNLLNEQLDNVRQEACNSLRLIGTPEALDALKEYNGNCLSGFRI